MSEVLPNTNIVLYVLPCTNMVSYVLPFTNIVLVEELSKTAVFVRFIIGPAVINTHTLVRRC